MSRKRGMGCGWIVLLGLVAVAGIVGFAAMPAVGVGSFGVWLALYFIAGHLERQQAAIEDLAPRLPPDDPYDDD